MKTSIQVGQNHQNVKNFNSEINIIHSITSFVFNRYLSKNSREYLYIFELNININLKQVSSLQLALSSANIRVYFRRAPAA